MRRTDEMMLKDELEGRPVSLPLLLGGLVAAMNVLSAVVTLALA